MTILDWQQKTTKALKEAGIESYTLDTLLLLENALYKDRVFILANPNTTLTAAETKTLETTFKRRLAREPLAYILGKKEFYGREFVVNENVLIPRPESENFIELLKKHRLSAGSLIDVGCGSGILGITAKLESPGFEVTLSDVSKEALDVAAENAKKLNAEVATKNQALFSSYYDVVLANLPYVPLDMNVEQELSFEPKIALFAEENGLKIYEDFCDKVTIFKPNFVLLESLKIQHQALSSMMQSAGYALLDTGDLVQLYKKSN